MKTAEDEEFERIEREAKMRLPHCDRCGKKLGGEGDMHTCSPQQPARQDRPQRMTPEMKRQVQTYSELGAYAAQNLVGAYDLFDEFWRVAMSVAPQPAQQEPYGWVRPNTSFNSGLFVEAAQCPPGWVGSAVAVYTTPQAQRKPLTDGWVPVTQSLLNEQHPWLYRPMWIARKSGEVVQGYYEWRQGHRPDRFITNAGAEWAFNAGFVMPIVKPTPPTIEAAHGIKE